MIPFPLPFEVDRVLAAIGWYALVAALVVAAVFAVLAVTRERPRLIWWSAAAVGVALVPAASLPGQPALPASVLIVLLGGGIAVVGGSAAAVLALDTAMGGVEPGLHGGILVAPRDARGEGLVAERTEVLRGGLTIGVLERVAAAGTIIAGFPEGLAVVVAVKGVGRFTELESSEARERFIIGTLASLVWACACALVVHLVIR
ncbi:hypothetical protein [Agromyces sp. SYSU T00194]|uniref:hypothetical protein n=1 Tax=Agromyces chitinivorans TaxID=3158560 RepID=UPI003394CCBF